MQLADLRLVDAMEVQFPGSGAIERRFEGDVVALEPGVTSGLDRVTLTP